MNSFGSGDGESGQFWVPESASHKNSDWIRAATTPLFDSPFYVTNQQGQSEPSSDVNNTSAGVAGASLRPAGAVDSAADNSELYGHSTSSDFNASHWQWQSVSAPATSHALAPSLSVLPYASWSGQGNPGDSIGSSSIFAQDGLGEAQSSQIDRHHTALRKTAQSRPLSTIAGTSSPRTSLAPATLATAPTTPSQSSRPQNRSQRKSNESTTTSPTRRRNREGIQRSPAAKHTSARTPIQPNGEEQARRIHMAAFTRGTSLVSDTSSQSREAAEAKSARMDSSLRAAESILAQNMDAGKAPGVMRTPNPAEGANDEYSLPLGKGFPIQIGSELFRLSGASIMSDCQWRPLTSVMSNDTDISRAPSYFSRFFEEQLRQNEDPNGGVKTLYIDRDPTTFQDICRHLQGCLDLQLQAWPGS